ncbi:hypothetical protein DAEQUDRAFT_734004 [Daedalea quercina L-15889]|uniref:F-box domain-containing protein n=1 Tax=Daedalea quercina L-15889 TaxID=1314783 RepID=A0A165KL99_9APHY|nr:hypothetical protein DAEQUDRAFT_734004 [Daedalea quercina L-15889]
MTNLSFSGDIHSESATTWLSNPTTRRFPQEVIEQIVDHLWDDPVALAMCFRVCHSWLAAAKYHLDEYKDMTIRSRMALTGYGRMFKLHRRERVNEQAQTMKILDNPLKPFAHLFPMLILGCDATGISQLEMSRVDWATTRPHSRFFNYLSYYTSTTVLEFNECCFGSPSQIRRAINALPNLTTLVLRSITLRDVPVTAPISRTMLKADQKLEKIELFLPRRALDRRSSPNSGADREAIRSILAECASHASVVWLSLDMDYFDSFAHLAQFIRHFPALARFTARCSPDRSGWDSRSPDDIAFEARTADANTQLFSIFELSYIRTTRAVQLMSLVSTPRACSKLEQLRITQVDPTGPTAELLLAVTHTLHLSGPALKLFRWEWPCNTDSLLCIPRLSWNTSLEQVHIVLYDMPPSLRRIKDTLSSLVSDITSPHMRKLRVDIHLELAKAGRGVEEESCLETDDANCNSTFLRGGVFHQVPGTAAVRVWLDARNNSPSHGRMAAKIKSHLAALFAPWLDCGTLDLEFRGDSISLP